MPNLRLRSLGILFLAVGGLGWIAPACIQPPATLAPTPLVPIEAPDGVVVRHAEITLQVYPYQAFTRAATDRIHNIPYRQFDAGAYQAATRTPVAVTYETLVVENAYLCLTFLPALGGRLYQVLFKPTQQTLLYNNPVLKPTAWGPAQQGGWLAAGGMEWALPVNEHGYEWGIPWSVTVDQTPDRVTVTLQDSAETDRVRAAVAVTLAAGAAFWTVHPRVTNGTDVTVPVQFWINAQLALNGKNVSPATEFLLPGTQVWIHSTANDFVPAADIPAADAQRPASPVAWPVIGGRDLASYRNWRDYLGVFAVDPSAGWAGVYDHTADLGIARVFPPATARGVKLFAFGGEFGGRSLFADDDSDYCELWGGLTPTFYDDPERPFAAGETREWDEYWIPLSRTGGVSGASARAALHLVRGAGGQVTVIAAATGRGTQGTLVLAQEGREIERWDVALDPGQVFRHPARVSGTGRLSLQLRTGDGGGTSRGERTVNPFRWVSTRDGKRLRL